MKLLLVGCGHMGQALLRCFEQNPGVSTIHIVDPAFESTHKVFRDIKDVTDSYEVVVLAVKPQVYQGMDPGSPAFGLVRDDSLVLSVMACVTGDQLQADFPNASIIRLMPNMGVAYGKGLTTAYMLNIVDRSRVDSLLFNTGKLLWVDTEAQLDVLTIFNGCGPGLLLALTQAFADVCVHQGFSKEIAETIMRQVFIGTSAMLENKADTIPDLIASIATKGGVTETCLKTMIPPLPAILEKTVQAGLHTVL